MVATRRIVVIASGGTIGKRGSGVWDVLDYQAVGERIPIATVLAEGGRNLPGIEISAVDIAAHSSKSFSPEWWASLARRVKEVVASEDVDGVVVTHGTSSLEETALFLDLTVPARVPIVLVGSMRPLGSHGSEAYVSLDAGIRVAADPASAGRGVLVSMNNLIFRAAGVIKGSATDVDAFTDRTFGPIGSVGAHGVHFQTERPVRSGAVHDVLDAEQLPRVDVTYAVVGADGVDVDAYLAHGAKGIVIAGMGTGYPAARQMDRLVDAYERGALIVASTRTGRPFLELPSDLLAAGFVTSGNLSPQQARVLAIVALAAGGSRTGAERIIAEALGLAPTG